MNIWGILMAVSASASVGAGIAGRGDVGAPLLLAAIVLALVFLYARMNPLQRDAYWKRVRVARIGGQGRCRVCGNHALSRNYPFCSDEHEDQHAASTAW